MEWFIFAIITATLTGFSVLIEKKVLIKENALKFATIFSLFCAFLVLFLVPQVDFKINLETLVLIYAASVFLTFGIFLFAKSLKHMQLSIAYPLSAFEPAIVAFIAFFTLKEVLKMNHIFGMGLLVVGAYVLELNYKKFNLFDPFKEIINSKYIHLIFLAILFYSLTTIVDRFVLSPNNSIITTPVNYLFFILLFTAFNFVVLISIFRPGVKELYHVVKRNGKLIFLMAIIVVAFRLSQFTAFSMPEGNAGLVIAIRRGGAAFISVLLGGEIFHEKNIVKKVIATIVMLLGIYLIII